MVEEGQGEVIGHLVVKVQQESDTVGCWAYWVEEGISDVQLGAIQGVVCHIASPFFV